MKIFRILLAVASITFALSSCTKNNPDPVWLEISEWELSDSSDPLNPVGELTHNFSDAWVYVDNELIGVFELPCKIPLIQEGAKDVKIYPAVWNNGISATKKIYPFVEVYETSIELNKNQVITLNPTTRYKDGVQFWIEDFETNVFQIGNGSSAVQIQKVNDPIILQSFNGDFFGGIFAVVEK